VRVNGRARLEPKVEGEQWKSGAVSAAQWTGVPLAQVLRLGDTALEVVFTGADSAYQRALPREVAMDRAGPGTAPSLIRRAQPDISTLLETGHFYFALTKKPFVPRIPCSWKEGGSKNGSISCDPTLASVEELAHCILSTSTTPVVSPCSPNWRRNESTPEGIGATPT
jgi:hypothetical protein